MSINSNLHDDIKRLRDLFTKATPAPWSIYETNNSAGEYHVAEHVAEEGDKWEENAALISASVEILPRLLDALEVFLKERDRRLLSDCLKGMLDE